MESRKVVKSVLYILWIISVLSACAPLSPTPVLLSQETVQWVAPTIPTTTILTAVVGVTCADIDAGWGRDWPAVLETLEQLLAANQSCGPEPLTSKLYAAYFNYATDLEQAQQLELATAQYQAAFQLDPQRQEAFNALLRLGALPDPTPVTCTSSLRASPDPAPVTTPDITQFVTLEGDQLWWHEQPFEVKGVNYYPRQTPWRRFLEEFDVEQVTIELDLIQQAGFNTLRIFLWYEPLFTCEPETAIPQEAVFAKLDTLFRLAQERDLKLIVTLNDLPDLVFRPLYTDWARYDTQTVYIVRRYRNTPAILAWDLRNEGDLDYGAQGGDTARFTQAEVLAWLEHVSGLVKANDSYHLITAGWWGDPTVTGSSVDFLSFHHWYDAQQLATRIADYRGKVTLPLLLEEVGYHSWATAPTGARDEALHKRLC
ncbi:MAG: cellulase family glycosylhydrolase [Anaerolineae bacterium]|nr:cellulase family glycosylhydrolase [Anaerolineae bacterium]